MDLAQLIAFLAGLLMISLTVSGAYKAKHRAVDSRVCSCTHGYGTHHDGKSCAAQVLRKYYMSDGTRNGKKWVTCPCLRFDGTPPVDVLAWSPPEVK